MKSKYTGPRITDLNCRAPLNVGICSINIYSGINAFSLMLLLMAFSLPLWKYTVFNTHAKYKMGVNRLFL